MRRQDTMHCQETWRTPAGGESVSQALTSSGTCPMKSFHSLCLSLLPILWPHGRAGMALLGPSPIFPKLCTT